MMRFAAVPLLLLAAVLPGLGKSTAADTTTPSTSPTTLTSTLTPTVTPQIATPQLINYTGGCEGNPEPDDLNGVPDEGGDPCPPPGRFCFKFPFDKFVTCPTTPVVRGLLPPTKELAVGPRLQSPEGTSQYLVTITSKVVCFPLDQEPINVYALASTGSASLTELLPAFVPSNGSSTRVVVDSKTGIAQLSLEVLDSSLQGEGLTVKARWPSEGIERLQEVVAPATPTPTATPLPGVTVTTVPSATGVPAASPTATPDTRSFFLRACVDPNPLVGTGIAPNGQDATLYGQTLPGAVCSASIVYSNGGRPSNFDPGPQTALSDGLVVFPFHEQTGAPSGTGQISCSFQGQTVTTATTFTILQAAPTAVSTPTAGPGTPVERPTNIPGSGALGGVTCSSGPGVQVAAGVNDPAPARHAVETVFGCLTVDGVPVQGAPMTATWHFFPADTYCFGPPSDKNGLSSCDRPLGATPSGSHVVVDVTFTYQGQDYVASTSFTVQ